MPSDKESVIVLRDEFRKLLKEQYGEMNTDEIEFAFRERSHTVEDWGKNMNLGLINRILKPYLYDRQDISQAEAGMKKDDTYTQEASINWWREQIQLSYNQYLKGEEPYIHWYMFDVAVQDKMIEFTGKVPEYSKERKVEVMDLYFSNASARKAINLYQCAR